MDNDYEDIQAWLALHKSPATQRAYRKEAERLILWAIVARGKALSSLTTKDATTIGHFCTDPRRASAGLDPRGHTRRRTGARLSTTSRRARSPMR